MMLSVGQRNEITPGHVGAYRKYWTWPNKLSQFEFYVESKFGNMDNYYLTAVLLLAYLWPQK